ncbi:hypothetical protein [Microbacterium enclense]|uniref:hypothetical protein n=1 Tax=Microbacterium enclense TaxID=993073 RepID=UPI003F7DF947
MLWVLEGAVRKWIPGTESIFYLLRDALLVGALIYAAMVAPTPIRRGLGIIFWGICGGLVVIAFTQALLSNVPFLVPVIGLRNLLAPLLPIYIVLRYRPANVWRNIAVVIMVFAPIEAFLAALQASSPARTLVNKQLGDDGASFTTAFGVVRASGTFSSPSGLTRFVALLLAVCLAALSGLNVAKPLVYVGLVSSVLILALSGSRGALLYAAIVACGWTLCLVASRNSRRSIAGVGLTAGATFAVAILAFPIVVNAFFTRLQTASDADAVDDRLAGSAFGFLEYSSSVIGDGIGSHGNAGIRLGSGSTWIEDENTRLVAELGVVGYAILLGRFVLAAAVIYVLVTHARRKSPIVSTAGALVAYGLVVGGISTQPTSQGYFALTVVIAASAFYSASPPSRSSRDEAPPQRSRLRSDRRKVPRILKG